MAATSLLSNRQEEELRLAILDYLHSAGLQSSYAALRQEAGVADFVADGNQKYSGLLEKKWTSVIRLQKKIMDLETQIAQLQAELQAAPPRKRQGAGGGGPGSGGADLLPRTPEKHRLSGHRSPVTKVAFHPVYSVVATASEDATVKIWDYETGGFERTVKGHTRAVHDVDFHPNGNLMGDFWDVDNDYVCVRTLFGHDHSVSAVAFSAQWRLYSTIRLWETATGYATKTIQGHEDWVRDVVWSEDGMFAASGSNDQSVIVWDASTWTEVAQLRGHTHVVEAVAFAPSAVAPYITKLAAQASIKTQPVMGGSPIYVASGSRDKIVVIWDVVSSQAIFSFAGHENWIRDLCFFASSPYLVTVSDDKTLRVWDLTTGKTIKAYEAHTHFVTSVAVHHTQGVVATGSVDQSCKLWFCA
ncbi:WD40-repeat-containing domain protein [Entophlyctis helioformis]|nr:WD40-repeat-containing domain protein [Entophlyctis helioformis]